MNDIFLYVLRRYLSHERSSEACRKPGCERHLSQKMEQSYSSSCSRAYRVAALRVDTPILRKIDARWLSTVRGLITSRSAICAFVNPSASNNNTSVSRAVNPAGEVLEKA